MVLILSLLIFWNKLVEKVIGEWPSVMKGLFWCLEMWCVGKKEENKMLNVTYKIVSMLAGVGPWEGCRAEVTLLEWTHQSRWGFPREGRTSSGKLYCGSRVCWWKRKEPHSEPLDVFWLLDRGGWAIKTSSIHYLKSKLLAHNVSMTHYKS